VLKEPQYIPPKPDDDPYGDAGSLPSPAPPPPDRGT